MGPGSDTDRRANRARAARRRRAPWVGPRAWADELELLAAIVEQQLDGLARLQYSAATGKRAPGTPLHVTRPAERAAQTQTTAERMAELVRAVSRNGN